MFLHGIPVWNFEIYKRGEPISLYDEDMQISKRRENSGFDACPPFFLSAVSVAEWRGYPLPPCSSLS
jgi:hypothetical protein